jgi:hypothetical protein
VSTDHLPRPPTPEARPTAKRTKLDASQVVEGLPLFVGSMPRGGHRITKSDGVSLYVPCAVELLPRPPAPRIMSRHHEPARVEVRDGSRVDDRPHVEPTPLERAEASLVGPGVEVHTVPLADNEYGLTPHEYAATMGAVVRVKRELEDEGSVFVACKRGLNRGPLVCALVVLSLSRLSGEEVIRLLREARGNKCLSNGRFLDLIMRFWGAWNPKEQGVQR